MAYVEAIQLARDQPAAAVEAIVRGSGNSNRAQAEAAYDVYRPTWNPWPSERALQALLDELPQPEARTARPADMIDLSILRELERSGWLAAHYRPS